MIAASLNWLESRSIAQSVAISILTLYYKLCGAGSCLLGDIKSLHGGGESAEAALGTAVHHRCSL